MTAQTEIYILYGQDKVQSVLSKMSEMLVTVDLLENSRSEICCHWKQNIIDTAEQNAGTLQTRPDKKKILHSENE